MATSLKKTRTMDHPGANIFAFQKKEGIQSELPLNLEIRDEKSQPRQRKKLKSVTVWNSKNIPVRFSSKWPGGSPLPQLVPSGKETMDSNSSWKLELMNAYLEGEENERKRVSQELHDGLGQMLSAIKINLDLIKFLVPDKFHSNLSGITNDALLEYRAVAQKLGSPFVKTHGLKQALKKMCGEFNISSLHDVKFRFPKKQFSLSSVVETHIFRICQELLNNASRHSRASQICIAVTPKRNGVSLIVRDNGIGINPEFLKFEKKGHGLENVSNRVNIIGGTIKFISNTGKGTIVKIHLNINIYDQTNHSNCRRCEFNPPGNSRPSLLVFKRP